MKLAIFTAVLWVGVPVLAATPGAKTVSLKNAAGQDMGTATLTQLTHGLKVTLDLKGLTPGVHAVHFHEKGECKGPKFESAGGHFAPAKKAHGFDSAEGPHAGDMPNITADEKGFAKAEFINPSVSLDKGEKSLLKSGGTSIVVHEKADDYKSQPAGDAGGRLACGVI